MNKKLTRRDFVRLLVLSAGGAALAACQRATEPIATATRAPEPIALPTRAAPTPEIARATATPVASPVMPTVVSPPSVTPATRSVPITPIKEFYTVSYGQDPFQVPKDWELAITGLVDKPLALSLDDIKAMPAVTEMRTLECISNSVGGELISNGVWKGVRLKDVLARAGVKPSAQYIKLEAYDGLDTGIPLDLGMHANALLVYEMNGEPLPIAHGAPLRCLFPGRYGMKQPKWIQTITLVDSLYRGYWEKQGWSNDAFILPNSRIDDPQDNAIVTTPTITLSGIAFSGEEGIAKIEIVWNDRSDWQETRLTRGPSPYVWTIWEWTGPAPKPGKHQLSVRVTTNSGKAQTRSEQASMFGEAFPNGTDKTHSIVIEFRG
ncbi:MAG: molybdopterin-dependent oxidoreductase [Chloroflexi bacterium]|nr:molybdopterin-dependent oxidoreductase [Chloroflexota bacterium]